MDWVLPYMSDHGHVLLLTMDQMNMLAEAGYWPNDPGGSLYKRPPWARWRRGRPTLTDGTIKAWVSKRDEAERLWLQESSG